MAFNPSSRHADAAVLGNGHVKQPSEQQPAAEGGKVDLNNLFEGIWLMEEEQNEAESSEDEGPAAAVGLNVHVYTSTGWHLCALKGREIVQQQLVQWSRMVPADCASHFQYVLSSYRHVTSTSEPAQDRATEVQYRARAFSNEALTIYYRLYTLRRMPCLPGFVHAGLGSLACHCTSIMPKDGDGALAQNSCRSTLLLVAGQFEATLSPSCP